MDEAEEAGLKKTGSRGRGITTLIFVFILLLGMVGVLLVWRTNCLDRYLPEGVLVSLGRGKEPPKEEEREPEDPTADWETFSSESFGFSFKYPKSYQITKNKGIEAGKADGELILSDEERPGAPWLYFMFNLAADGGACSLDRSYETAIEDGGVVILSQEFSDRAKQEECAGEELENWSISFGIGGTCQCVEGIREGNEITAFFSYRRDGPDFEEELKRIIGTIKITKEELYCQ